MSASLRAIPADDAALMHSILKRIATGPELSKDISRERRAPACAWCSTLRSTRCKPGYS